MMSEHTEIQEELASYVATRLTGAARDRVDAHLESCAECRRLVACGEGIAAGLQALESSDPHPDPLVLHAFSQNASATSDPSVARHLETCETCSLEVAAWGGWNEWKPRPAPPVMHPEPRPTFGRAGWTWPAFATGGALGAAAVLIVLALVPGIAPEGPAWSGAVQPLWLDEPYLDASAPPTASLADGQPYLPLAVRFTPPSHLGLGDDMEFVLEDAGGRALWSHRIDAQAVRERLASPGFVLLLAPADTVQPGDCLLRVTAIREDTREPLLELPFKLAP